MLKKIALLFLFVVIATSAFAGGRTDNHDDREYDSALPEVDRLVQGNERLRIVATTSIVGDVVANVAGEAADLTVLMSVGQNPHSYEATPSALRSLEDAHLVFMNGFGLEEGLFEDIDRLTNGIVVSLSAGIDAIESESEDDDEEHHEVDDHEDEHHHGDVDPHVWTDPRNVKQWVSNLVAVLTKADPDNAAVYEQNGERYGTTLDSLDSELRNTFEAIPANARKLVTDHASFTYFAAAYGFEVIGAIVPGTSDQAQPSTQAVSELVDVIRDENVNAIYIGTTASRGISNLAEMIAKEIGRPIKILSTLTGSLTKEGEPGDTYVGYMRYNASQILAGLDAP